MDRESWLLHGPCTHSDTCSDKLNSALSLGLAVARRSMAPARCLLWVSKANAHVYIYQGAEMCSGHAAIGQPCDLSGSVQ